MMAYGRERGKLPVRLGDLYAHMKKAQDEHGIERPMVILGEFKFRWARPDGSNPDWCYVTYKGEYIGKFINDSQVSSPMAERIDRSIVTLLETYSSMTSEQMKQELEIQGKRTGICGCCGRKLTNHASIDRGIGPICAERYGF